MTTLRFATIWDETVSRRLPDEMPKVTERFVSIWDRPAPRRAAADKRTRPVRRMPRFYV